MNVNSELNANYFNALYSPAAGYQDNHVELEAADETNRPSPSADGLWDSADPLGKPAKNKFKHFRALPEKALEDAHMGTVSLWIKDKEWACTLLHKAMPLDLAISIFAQYVRKWEGYLLHKKENPNSKSRTNQANVWLRKRIKMVKRAVATFPVAIEALKHDGLRKNMAQFWADKCMAEIVALADQQKSLEQAYDVVKLFADAWGFSVKAPKQVFEQLDGESDDDYELRVKNETAGFLLSRLIDETWWERKINVAYRRFCEHCQILNGRARQGVSIYLSDVGLRDFRCRKAATKIALSKMVARNEETGDEVNMLDAFNASSSNPAIRRHELMVRMRGFQDIAEENKLISGFFTLTAPSKYHAYNMNKDKKGSRENKKYAGFTPTETQQYLSAVWAKARAALKRLDVPFFGFRVCEPHHDETPHWHALFFFKPEHEQIIRYMLADYFTQTDRDELNAEDGEFDEWANLVVGKNEDGRFIKAVDNQVADNSLANIIDRVKSRFLYKRMDPKKGGACGYIAKYIAKNVDGYMMDDEEDSNTSADRNAEAACGWASTWGIRQFQQIGGPSVSVWRELRRLQQDEKVKEDKLAAKAKGERYQPPIRALTDLKNQEHIIEVARIAAQESNWGMFIHAMGGLFATRNTFPIRMVYKPADNAYGEQVKKLKGVGSVDKTMITHSDSWVITKVGAAGGFDLKRSASFDLGVLSVTVRDSYEDIVIEGVWSEFKQLGESISLFDFERVMLGATLTINSTLINGIKRQRKAKLKRSTLDHGGYSVNIWEVAQDLSGL